MKKITTSVCSIILALVCLLLTTAAKAQGTSGIYLSAEDFINHKLSYQAEAAAKHIRLNEFFKGSTIRINQNGTPVELHKDKIFGYRLNGTDYRFFNNSAYQIVSQKGIYLYSAYGLEPATKGMKRVQNFYFSVKPDTQINLLTMDNLQTAFQKDTRFLYAVEGFFKSDNQLADYDSGTREYKLEYIYAHTIN